MDYIVVLYAVFAALTYSLVWYAKNYAQIPETFSYTKFAATLIVGAAVGLVASFTGNPITGEGIETQLLAYGAVTALVETLLKTLLAKLNLKYPGS